MRPHIVAPYFGSGETRPHKELKDFDKPTLFLIDCIDMELLNSDRFENKFYLHMEPFEDKI